MRPVTLNLASRPFRNNLLVGSVLGIASAALLAASGFNLYVFLGYGSSYAQLQREQADDRVKIASLQVEERRLVEEVRKRNFKKVFEQGKIASELVVRGTFSWTQLFNTLEEVVPPEVVMTAIRPNITTEGIVMRIEGVAKNHGALLAFETRLQQNTAFAKVFPANERRLNPNLPDITFLLTCDYLPQRPPAPDLVASAASPEATGPAATGPAANAPSTTGAGATAPAATTPGSAMAAPRQKPAAHAADVIVGRDGEPRDRRAAGGPIVAPGALYVPEREAAQAVKPARRPPAARGDAARTGKPVPAKANPPAGAPGEPFKRAASPAAPKAAPQGTPSGAPATTGATTRTAAAGQSPPAGTAAGPQVPGPRPLRTVMPAEQGAMAAKPRPEKPPTAAVRLDVPLTFVSRPVEEIYKNLAEAHGVRFDLDGGVDRRAPLTLNLRGRRLEDAILLVSGTAHHKIRRVADGVYKVSADEGGRAIGERPINEEPIKEDGP